ncbi:Chromatin structure-remodeling complex protein rsc9 [Cladochytrium tenue]|nr:Chromatin structure-remodeling complex protein rsc9 [Cladochytrium tenue]
MSIYELIPNPQVTEDRGWKRITNPMNLPATCTNAAYVAKLVYRNSLYNWELAKRVKHDTPTAVTRQPPPQPPQYRPAMPPPISTPRVQPAYAAPPPPPPRPIYTPLIRVGLEDETNEERYLHGGHRNRILLALQSGMPNEVDWAFSRLVKLSKTCPDGFDLATIPGILGAVASFADPFFSQLKLNTSLDNFETTLETNGWTKTKNGSLSKMPVFQELSVFCPRDTEEFVERVLQVMHILRNFSHMHHNRKAFLSEQSILTLLAKAMALPSYSSYVEIKRHAVDIFENLSGVVTIRGKNDFYLACMKKMLYDSDRSLLLGSLRSIAKLCGSEANHAVLADADPSMLVRLFQLLLTPNDEELVYAVLDVIYMVSCLGADASAKIASSIPANVVKLLIAFLQVKYTQGVQRSDLEALLRKIRPPASKPIPIVYKPPPPLPLPMATAASSATSESTLEPSAKAWLDSMLEKSESSEMSVADLGAILRLAPPSVRERAVFMDEKALAFVADYFQIKIGDGATVVNGLRRREFDATMEQQSFAAGSAPSSNAIGLDGQGGKEVGPTGSNGEQAGQPAPLTEAGRSAPDAKSTATITAATSSVEPNIDVEMEDEVLEEGETLSSAVSGQANSASASFPTAAPRSAASSAPGTPGASGSPAGTRKRGRPRKSDSEQPQPGDANSETAPILPVASEIHQPVVAVPQQQQQPPPPPGPVLPCLWGENKVPGPDGVAGGGGGGPVLETHCAARLASLADLVAHVRDVHLPARRGSGGEPYACSWRGCTALPATAGATRPRAVAHVLTHLHAAAGTAAGAQQPAPVSAAAAPAPPDVLGGELKGTPLTVLLVLRNLARVPRHRELFATLEPDLVGLTVDRPKLAKLVGDILWELR